MDRFSVIVGVHGWQVFDTEINAPIGECYEMLREAVAARDTDNQMYDDEQSRQANRCDTVGMFDGDFLYDSMRDEQVHEAEDRAADYERELQDG